NVGIKAAKGEYIAFTDADCVVDRNCLKELVKGFDSEDIAACGGKVLARETTTLIQKFIEESKVLAQGLTNNDNVEREIYRIVTANSLFRKKIFDELGYFDESFITCEDTELGYRISFFGYQMKYVPGAIVYHQHVKSLRQFCRWHINYGLNNYFLHTKFKEMYYYCQDFYYFIEPIPIFFNLVKKYSKKAISLRHKFLFLFLDFTAFICCKLGEIKSWLRDYFSRKLRILPDEKDFLHNPLLKKKRCFSFKGDNWSVNTYIFDIILEGSVALFDSSRKKYFALRYVSSLIWRELIRKKNKDIVSKISQEYKISLAQAEEDLVSFLKELEENNIILKQ
ncbi:MAG: PqqD family peptide modification chaperone, partial [Candidatus Omnitrophota bacterium]